MAPTCKNKSLAINSWGSSLSLYFPRTQSTPSWIMAFRNGQWRCRSIIRWVPCSRLPNNPGDLCGGTWSTTIPRWTPSKWPSTNYLRWMDSRITQSSPLSRIRLWNRRSWRILAAAWGGLSLDRPELRVKERTQPLRPSGRQWFQRSKIVTKLSRYLASTNS
jgi:hypothetical protein